MGGRGAAARRAGTMKKIGFDNKKYLEMQSTHIRERIGQFGNKLYLEFGGKLFDDYHASRVLPGFEPDSKIRMLKELRESAEIVIAICASDIEKNKVRGDLGITYDVDVLRLIDAFRGEGLMVGSVVVTQYAGQAAADAFRARLESLGVKAGYAKFETFPIWNLPLQHPVNLAYEAATADLGDVNMIDPFHLSAYGETTVNYNRDVEIFPVLSAMFEKITGECPYKSPTDMGVNMAGNCIFDDEAVQDAARQEIVRRYYAALCDRKQNQNGDETVYKLELIMQQAKITPAIRPVIDAALQVAEETGNPAAAIELPDGEVVTGKTTGLMGASSATLLNALKRLAGIEHEKHLISPEAIMPIQTVKVKHLGSTNPRLHSDEVLIALAISAAADPLAAAALEQLSALRGCDAHSSVILSPADSVTYSKLGMHLTCEPQYETNKLYHR